MCFTVELSKKKVDNETFRWRCASGKHPYPSRTRRLRLKRPMILCWRRHGKAGGCREPQKKSRGKGDEIERHHRRCNPHQRGSAVWIAGFTSDSSIKEILCLND